MSESRPTVIGVDLGGTNVRAGRVDPQGLAAHAAMGLRDTNNSDAVLEDIYSCIDQVLAPEAKAIGIGVPSLVDSTQGIVYNVANIPAWQEVHLKELLERRYGLPVQVNNDANCFALGEFHFGLGRGSRHMVGLIIGTGLGAGLIVRGRLFEGSHCGAGEIGSLPFKGDTLEHYVSGPRFSRILGVDGQTLLDGAEKSDPRALEAFADFGGDLGCAVKTILFAYDPDTIILGGSVSKSFPYFEASLHRALRDFPYPHVLPDLRILPTQNPFIPVLGAAALCLDVAS